MNKKADELKSIIIEPSNPNYERLEVPTLKRMRGVKSYDDIVQETTASFLRQAGDITESNLRMIGILFVRPSMTLAKRSIVPNMAYFHHRSGNNVDFFCAGYSRNMPTDPDQWQFSDRHFDEMRRQVENATQWRYGGGVELILTNAKHTMEKSSAEILLQNSIVCNLDRMVNEGAISSVEEFFEKIFQFAETRDLENPVWSISDNFGKKAVGGALKRLVLSLLPKNLSRDVRNACKFAVVDLTSDLDGDVSEEMELIDIPAFLSGQKDD